MARKKAEKKPVPPVVIHVSPSGNDRWSGRLPKPEARRKDGPMATIHAAVARARRYQGKEGLKRPVNILVRGGTYCLTEPLVLNERDSGAPRSGNPWTDFTQPKLLTIAAYKGEKPILSGGRRITGWKTSRVNGVDCWVAAVPEAKGGKWNFHQLWVNGKRRERTVLPAKGFFRMESVPDKKEGSGFQEGQQTFICHEGDIRQWKNLRDVEIHTFNFWIDEHQWIKRFNLATRLVELDRKSKFHLLDEWRKEGAQYRVENVFEELRKPGQWYLDRKQGLLYYIPRKGELPGKAEVIAPCLPELLRIEGRDPDKKAARGITCEGLTFKYNEWVPKKDWSSSAQAAHEVPGIINLKNARNITFRNCVIEHSGTYGIDLESTFEARVEGCTLRDLGAGGVKVWHGCKRTHVLDNEIADGGHIYGAGVGALIGKTMGTRLIHNHIHDFYYSGVSVGWTWGYQESDTWGNIIEHNHIHDLGKYMLSDMGGIYCLGTQQGTRLRFNHIHDVFSRTYGGWGIYTDEGSTHILIENNLVYNTKCGGFHQHYGRENLIQNNIFYHAIENQFARSRFEPHSSFTFRRNICVIREGLFWKGDFRGANAVMDGNMYWHEKSRGLKGQFAEDFSKKTAKDGKVDFRRWKRLGFDRGSIVANPEFVNPRRGNFGFRPGSPFARIGFIPFDVSDSGPRRPVRTEVQD